ncbi:MAG TPA: CbrC family protein [Gemmatimonadaceae bacterium]|nr:CbrC family protein [Gemmatimonadaceae bacterium]
MTDRMLPAFRYHPFPVDTGSVTASEATCAVCEEERGFIYAGPVYAEGDFDDTICPWCIADGSAHRSLGATFVDSEAFAVDTPDTVIAEISERTPGYSAWQPEEWPSCCGDAAAFIGPVGIAEIREKHRHLEGFVLRQIIYGLGISGSAATRMLESLHRDSSPTAYLFKCLHCEEPLVHVDHA